MANLRPPSSSTENFDVLLKPSKMFLALFLSSFQMQSPFKSCAKGMINIVILILALKLVGSGALIEGLVGVKHWVGTKSSPVFNLRAEDFNSFSLVKSALVSTVSKGSYKKATKGATC